MKQGLLLRILSTVAFAGTLLVNTLANTLPINGLNTGQVSDLYPSMFTPIGLTFSIWSVIYVLLIAFLVFAWIRSNDAFFDKILPWFIASCILNLSWILVWHYLLPEVSVIIMLSLLVVLINIFRRVEGQGFTMNRERFFIELPFTLYLAWICVATIANISALLVSYNWDGGFLSPEIWTIVMMSVATLLAIKITLDFKVPFFAVVVIWALLGIHLRWQTGHHLIFYTSLVLISAMVITVVITAFRKKHLL